MKVRGFLLMIIVMLFVVTAAWIGITVYDSVNNVDINPNASSLRNRIKPNFNTEPLIRLDQKVEGLEVDPEVFHKLEDEGLESLQDSGSSSSDEESSESESTEVE